jgi:hypothetical protein
MAELFDSYINPNNPSEVYCDLTVIPDCAEPNTRLLCGTLQIFCGSNTFCSGLIVGNGLVLCDCGDSWNCNLCGNDTPFWIPFQNGDTYTFQFQQPQTIVGHGGWYSNGTSYDGTAQFTITTCCGKEIEIGDRQFENIVVNQFIGEFQTTQVGGNATISPIQQIEFDLYAIAELLISQGYDPCFYFNFTFADKKGEEKQTFCSEPFKLEVCADKKQSVLIESEYSSTDCFGLYYGTNFTQTFGGLPFPYSNQIRIPCAFEQTNFNITKSIIDTSQKTTNSQVCENWEMNTFPIPQRFAKLLASIVAGADIMIDGVEYQTSGEIPKNNEIGSRWWITIKFEHCECSKSLTCL